MCRANRSSLQAKRTQMSECERHERHWAMAKKWPENKGNHATRSSCEDVVAATMHISSALRCLWLPHALCGRFSTTSDLVEFLFCRALKCECDLYSSPIIGETYYSKVCKAKWGRHALHPVQHFIHCAIESFKLEFRCNWQWTLCLIHVADVAQDSSPLSTSRDTSSPRSSQPNAFNRRENAVKTLHARCTEKKNQRAIVVCRDNNNGHDCQNKEKPKSLL